MGNLTKRTEYWNEYLPKVCLAALLPPAMLFLISILKNKWWHIFYISVPLLFTYEWLTNGYMDGYLAVYAGLATFYWGRWLNNKYDVLAIEKKTITC